MADTLYLQQRRQGWYLRLRIPRDLQELYGKAAIVLSLKTRDLSVAQSERWKHVAEWHERFKLDRASLRGEGPTEAPREIYNRTLSEAREGQYDNTLAIGDEESEEGIDIARDLLIEEIDAKGEASPQQQATLDALTDRLFESRGRAVKLRSKYRMPFSEAAAGYLAERQREAATAMKRQTEGQESAVFRLFADYCDNKPIGEVSPKDATGFLEKVATLDPLWGRSPATKERSLDELLATFGRKSGGLSGRTLNRYSRSLAKVWKWAKRRGETSGDNPFADLKYREARSSETGYLAFSLEQLNNLFAVSPASIARDYAHELFWVPRIGLYSGMRLNEICSLSAKDVKEEGGIRYFDIPAAKSEAGVRLVPIHSKLIEMGLLEMVPETGSLFPRLIAGGPDDKLGWYVSRRFTGLRRKAGATVVSPKTGKDRLSFHSLRKNVVRCLERARVPQNEAAEVIGHEKAGMTFRVYNPDGLTIEQRKEIIEKVGYPGLKLAPGN